MTRAVLLLLALAATAAASTDESTVILRAGPGDPAAQHITGRVAFTDASRRVGGYGWAEVTLRNPGQKPHTIRMSLRSADAGDVHFRFRRSLRLDPGEQATAYLPLPAATGSRLELSVDGVPNSAISLRPHSSGGMGGISILYITSGRREIWDFNTKLVAFANTTAGRAHSTTYYYGAMRGAVQHTEPFLRTPAELPDRWPLLTGFDLIVVDTLASGIADAGRQRLLVQYLRAGGNLLITPSEPLPDGPLKQVLTSEQSGFYGFGSWFRLATPRLRMVDATLKNWLDGRHNKRPRPFTSRLRPFSGPPIREMQFRLTIPGLGEVPVRLFFVLILGFAVLVGPLSHFYLKRRRKQLLMLVTIPAFGLGFTALILGYGLFSEGFGIKGAQRSITLLDQRTQEALTYTSRTLFAGLSPNSLEVDSDTYLFSVGAVNQTTPYYMETAQTVGPIEADLDDGVRLSGSILPSRTPTAICTVKQGRARERLRFRRLPNDRIEVLYAPEFRPVDEAGTLILRDFQGAYHVRTDAGTLKPMTSRPTPIAVAVRSVWQRFLNGQATQNSREEYIADTGASFWGARNWTEHLTRDLLPGTYLALVEDVPSDTDLGIEAEYFRSTRVVLGRLAREDFLE